tara:strand:- start:275 stop:415 length:141 start_codon:yes stop_codon:yes gene_type:complete
VGRIYLSKVNYDNTYEDSKKYEQRDYTLSSTEVDDGEAQMNLDGLQ